MGQRVYIGSVTIDSGQLVVGDSCYACLLTDRQRNNACQHQSSEVLVAGLSGTVVIHLLDDGEYEVYLEDGKLVVDLARGG